MVGSTTMSSPALIAAWKHWAMARVKSYIWEIVGSEQFPLRRQ